MSKEKDRQAAVDYCWRTSAGQERNFRQKLFHILLQIYLDSTPAVGAVADLLNDHAAAFDAVAVLRAVPEGWSVQLVSRFLQEALRSTFHLRRMTEVEAALASAEQHRHSYTRVRRTQATMPRTEKNTGRRNILKIKIKQLKILTTN